MPFLRFVAFDNPNQASCELAFEKRFATLLDDIPFNHSSLVSPKKKKKKQIKKEKENKKEKEIN